MSNNNDIIIKRVKKVAGGHHGGAWKVAYADFVTAMMAFFLLLWLLNATEAENLAGLADYFAPTVGVKDEMGIGFRGGRAALSEGIGADRNTNKGIVFGGVPTGPITKVTNEILEQTDQSPAEQIKVVINETETDKKGSDETDKQTAEAAPPAEQKEEKNKLDEENEQTSKAVSAAVEDMVKNRRIDEGSIEIKRTPEGLLIEIKDLTGNSMFESGNAVMKKKLRDALIELSRILRNVPNSFAIIGHTSAASVTATRADYGKWELSADRANATRLFLERNGVDREQMSRVEGRADNVPFDARKPESPVNNRINILILNKSDTPDHKKSTPDAILLDTRSPKVEDLIKESMKPADDKKKKAPEPPTKINKDMKQLLDATSSGRKDAAVPAEAEPATIIDLNRAIERNLPAAPAPQQNEQMQRILQDVSQPKPAAPEVPDSPTDNNIPDLDIRRGAPTVPAVPAAPTTTPPSGDNLLEMLREGRSPGTSE